MVPAERTVGAIFLSNGQNVGGSFDTCSIGILSEFEVLSFGKDFGQLKPLSMNMCIHSYPKESAWTKNRKQPVPMN